MNKNIRQKLIIAAALMIAATASAFAQGNGLAGINEATSMVSSYFDPGTKLIYAIGAVVMLLLWYWHCAAKSISKCASLCSVSWFRWWTKSRKCTSKP